MKQIKEKTAQKALFYWENGFHCAEAVAAAVLEGLKQDPGQAVAHATAFGGGFGRSFDEACGALSGALIVIGHLYGRQNLGKDWDIPAGLAQEIRQQFLDTFETTHCGTLRERFGEAQSKECGKIVKKVAQDIVELLSVSYEKTVEPCECETQ